MFRSFQKLLLRTLNWITMFWKITKYRISLSRLDWTRTLPGSEWSSPPQLPLLKVHSWCCLESRPLQMCAAEQACLWFSAWRLGHRQWWLWPLLTNMCSGGCLWLWQEFCPTMPGGRSLVWWLHVIGPTSFDSSFTMLLRHREWHLDESEVQVLVAWVAKLPVHTP